jgi:toxin YoeB
MMIKSWDDAAWQDYIYWQGQDKKTLKRINLLLKDIDREPYVGLGKPEVLKYEYSRYWSRRIDEFNRIVYRIHDEKIEIIQCGSHYRDE